MSLEPLLDGFVNELAKIAAAPSSDNIQEGNRQLLRGAAGAVGGLAGTVGLNRAALGVMQRHETDPSMTEPRMRSSLEDMRQHMKIKNPVGLEIDPMHRDISAKAQLEGKGGFGPHFQPYKMDPKSGGFRSAPTVKAPPGLSEDILAHEMGHAKQWSGKLGIPKAVISGLSHSATVPSSVISSAAAAGQTDPTWTPALVNAAIHAPVLAHEGGASMKALSYLAKKHGLRAALGKSKGIAGGFGSYASTAVAPFAITGGRKLYRKIKGLKKRQD